MTATASSPLNLASVCRPRLLFRRHRRGWGAACSDTAAVKKRSLSQAVCAGRQFWWGLEGSPVTPLRRQRCRVRSVSHAARRCRRPRKKKQPSPHSTVVLQCITETLFGSRWSPVLAVRPYKRPHFLSLSSRSTLWGRGEANTEYTCVHGGAWGVHRMGWCTGCCTA